MGFTVPIDSAVTGEVAPAALWNTFVRENLMATMHLLARKSANQTSTSTTLANDNHLVTPTFGINEVWFFSTYVLVDSPSAADFKVGFVWSSGTMTANWGIVQYDSANGIAWMAQPGTGATGNLVRTQATASDNIGTNGGTTQGIPLHAIVSVGGTAGTVTLQWAQLVASGTTTVFTNSFMMGMRLSP